MYVYLLRHSGQALPRFSCTTFSRSFTSLSRYWRSVDVIFVLSARLGSTSLYSFLLRGILILQILEFRNSKGWGAGCQLLQRNCLAMIVALIFRKENQPYYFRLKRCRSSVATAFFLSVLRSKLIITVYRTCLVKALRQSIDQAITSYFINISQQGIPLPQKFH